MPFYVGTQCLFCFFLTVQLGTLRLGPALVALGATLACGLWLIHRLWRRSMAWHVGAALALEVLACWVVGVGWAVAQQQAPHWQGWILFGSLVLLWICVARRQISSAQPEIALPPGACVGCQQRPQAVLLLPCRHHCLCLECAVDLPMQCPVCRAAVQGALLPLYK